MKVKGIEAPVNIVNYLLQEEEEYVGITASAKEKGRVAAQKSLKNSVIAQQEMLDTSGILEIGFANVSVKMALLQQESLSVEDSAGIDAQLKELAKIQTGLKTHILSLKQLEEGAAGRDHESA